MTQFVSPAQGDVTATKTPSWRFGTSNRAKLGPKKGGTGPRYPKVKLQSSRKYPPDILKLDISIICLASPLKVPTTEGPRWQPPAPGPTWSHAQPGSPSLALGPGKSHISVTHYGFDNELGCEQVAILGTRIKMLSDSGVSLK
jgi:hypothetical protein